jgi:hypothetical protein
MREVAPFLEARPHRPEIAGRDAAYVRGRDPLLPLRDQLLGRDTRPRVVQVDRDDVGERGVGDAGRDFTRPCGIVQARELV